MELNTYLKRIGYIATLDEDNNPCAERVKVTGILNNNRLIVTGEDCTGFIEPSDLWDSWQSAFAQAACLFQVQEKLDL